MLFFVLLFSNTKDNNKFLMKKIMLILKRLLSNWISKKLRLRNPGGALKYESDVQVPTGERK